MSVPVIVRSRKGKTSVAMTLLAAALMAVAGCSSSGGGSSPAKSTANGSPAGGGSSPAAPAKLTTVNYGLSPINSSHLWVIIATDEKTFAPYGISLKLTFFQSDSDAIPALASGSVDIAEPSAQGAIAAIQKEPSLKIIMGPLKGSVQDLVVQKGITSVTGLKGKKVSVNAVGSSVDYFTLVGMLNAKGVSTGQVNYINGGGVTARVAAFESKAVQGVLVAPPLIDTLTATGAVDLGPGNSVPVVKEGLSYAGLAKTSWYTANHALAVNFLKGYQATFAFMANPANKAKVIADIASGLKTDTAGATETYNYVIGQYGALQDPTGAVTTDELQAAMKLSSLKAVPDSTIQTYYDNSLAEEAAQATGAKSPTASPSS